MDLAHLPAATIAEKVRRRELSAAEVAQHFIERVQRMDAGLGCFLTMEPESVLGQAASVQARLDAGDALPLAGVPIALKDNLSTAGTRTTCASRILGNYVPTFDATVVERLKAAGCVVLGKTNLDEFAMGTSTEFSAYQLTRNPWDTERSPGGSSGGSAAAVAARLAPVSLGSDTGGSIRQPASLCGVVGYKPTYGRNSRYGLVAFGSSLDQIGPFGNTVEDVALVAEAMTGHDPKENTSLQAPPVSARDLKSGTLQGKRIGLPTEFFADNLHPGVRSAVEAAIDTLRGEGATFEFVDLPAIKVGVTTYYIIAPAEASSNLARFDGVRYGPRIEGANPIEMVEKTRAQLFGHEVKARIMIGTYALSAGYYDAYYVRAQQVREVMRREFEAAFDRFDLLLGPTSPIPAFKLGELKNDPLALKLLDYCTIPANMNGMPALSLNCGFADGLPVGLQLMARPMDDERLLQAAHCAERALGATPPPALA